MKREPLLRLLHAYSPSSTSEEEDKKRFIAFATQNPNCFDRELLIGHITASAWLLNRDGSKALLLHHAKLKKWVQPGGHCDGNPDVLDTALTEAREESGIESISPLSSQIFDLDIHQIPEHRSVPSHLHYDVRFLLQIKSEELPRHNFESTDFKWIGKDRRDLPTEEQSVVRLFEKWRLF